jgi:DNA-binding transcriptional LysR family regulator
MELKWLEDFLTLSASGNFRAAAALRGVSQPAFSRRIQSLEAWVGATLVDRSSQPSRLTDAGEVFKPPAQEMVRLAYLARDDIQVKIQDDSEKIRFSTLSTLAQFFMPTWLKKLQSSVDTDKFLVRTDFGSVADYLAALEENTVDFFICYEDPKDGFHNDETKFISLKLGEEALVPVVSPDKDGTPSWWLPAKPEGPIPYLHTASTPAFWPLKDHLKKRYADLNFNIVYESSIATALKAMAIEGFGVAWIPNAIIADDLANGRLVRAAELADDIIVDIKIYRCAKYSEPRVEEFWQALLQQNMLSVDRG